MIIALPIRIQSPKMPYSVPSEDKEPEESEEVQYREQRIVSKKHKPESEPRYRGPRLTENHQFSEDHFTEPYFLEPQLHESHFAEPHQSSPHFMELPDSEPQYTEPQLKEPQYTEARTPEPDNKDDSENRRQPDFLTWNPNNRMMVLQINDIIGVKHQESDESEENEKGDESPGLTKPGQHWSYQGSFDFNDARLPSPNADNEPRGFRNKSSSRKKKKTAQNYSTEDTESDVYGTDPVVHFLRNRHKQSGRPFDFPIEEDDEFGNWWRL